MIANIDCFFPKANSLGIIYLYLWQSEDNKLTTSRLEILRVKDGNVHAILIQRYSKCFGFIQSNRFYNAEKIDYLLKNGAKLNIIPNFGDTPIIAAAGTTQWNLVERLLDLGADPFLEVKLSPTRSLSVKNKIESYMKKHQQKNKNMEHNLRPFWEKYFGYNWKFGLFLIVIICLPRFILVLNANENANYSYIGLIMLVSAITPFVFLSKHGRKAIGLCKPANYSWLLIAVAIGLIFSIALYFAGELFYGNSYENWYLYIGKSYNIPAGISGNDKLVMFAIMAVTGMIFSPIGEELFFRGIVHSSFAKSVGNTKASIIDSTAFALTHISHFGLVFINNKWTFLAMPTVIWVISMFLVSVLFFTCKYKSDSLLGAILCHSAFNLGMIYCIFYLIN